MSVAERGTGIALRTLGRLAGSGVLDRLGVRRGTEAALYRVTRDGFRAIDTAGRTFTAASRRAKPARSATSRGGDLFDLGLSDEQEMLRSAFGEFAAERLRPAAAAADDACAAPPELLAQAAELGVTMLGVPEELGGAVSERSATTTVLAAEALARGDMGIAVAALSPGAVATALSLWGSADQQAAYVPALVGDDVPAAALAILEPRPLFDPFALSTTARRDGSDYVLTGVKALVPRAGELALALVAAEIEGGGPALFCVEADGLAARPAPAMGIRAAATGDLALEDVRVPASALVGDGDPAVYAECVHRARLAWCALAVGTSQAVLDHVVPYVNERVAFGEPISNRQSVAFAIADVAIELEGMRLATLRAASRADREEPFSRDAAIAHRLCVEYGTRIGSEGVQLLGGHGYVKEHPVERWYRDLQAIGVMEGALLV